MKNKNLWIIAFVAIITIGIIGCGGNDDPPPPVVCNCPNGTLHLVGETCCDGEGCTCEKNVVGVRANVPGKATNGIAITNRQDISASDFASMVTAVETALNHSQLESTDRQNYIKNNIKEIKIIPMVFGDAPDHPINDIFTIEVSVAAISIRGALRTWCEENNIN